MRSASADLSRRSLLPWGVALLACYTLPLVLRSEYPAGSFLWSNGLAVAVLGVFLFVIRRDGTWRPARRGVAAAVILWALLFRLPLVWLDPAASDDMFRYLWDGRVAASGVNPYRFAPVAPELAHLRTDTLPSRVTYPEMRTIYPPLAQGLFALTALLAGPSVAAWKLLLVLLDAAVMLVILLLLRRSGLPDTALIAYAWSPLPVLYVALDGHLDPIGVFFMLLALLAVLHGKRLASGLLLGLAGLARVVPLLLMPLLAPSQKRAHRTLTALPAVAVFLLGTLPFLEPTGGLTESFVVFSSTWEFNSAVYPLVRPLLGSAGSARIVCAAALLLIIGVLALSRGDLLRKAMLALCAFILLTPTLHPWYLLLLSPFLALRWSPAVAWLLAASGLANFTVLEFQGTGVWTDHAWVRAAQFIPFAGLLVLEQVRPRSGEGRGLIVFLKYPTPGRVKTRLGAVIGMDRAAEVYRALAERMVGIARVLGGEGVRSALFATPESDPPALRTWLGPGCELRVQEGPDLGARMRHAFERLFAEGVERAVIVGTDVPDLEAGRVREAFHLLDTHDVVIGPSPDGGYYLLGMRPPLKELFTGISWSTPGVFRATRDRAEGAGLRVALLPPLSDIDTPEAYTSWLAGAR